MKLWIRPLKSLWKYHHFNIPGIRGSVLIGQVNEGWGINHCIRKIETDDLVSRRSNMPEYKNLYPKTRCVLKIIDFFEEELSFIMPAIRTELAKKIVHVIEDDIKEK